MSRKRCHRKVWLLRDPIAMAISGAAITASEELDKLRMIELQALESFRVGQATKRDWDHLADLCNLTETFCQFGIGREAMQVCERAQEALRQAHRRHVEHGRIAMTMPELDALREVFEYHDLQRSSVARSEYERAIQTTVNRIRSAHPSLKVMLPAQRIGV